ncbi:MAG TPA: hypothetical protein VMU87_12000 [Stellaceae bacterium]|nr:hypothetical protein [Stellaceae bacterium]
MPLPVSCVEMLVDLVEVRLGALAALDSDDRRDVRMLKRCRDELTLLLRGAPDAGTAQKRPVGRPRKTDYKMDYASQALA